MGRMVLARPLATIDGYKWYCMCLFYCFEMLYVCFYGGFDRFVDIVVS